MEKSGAHAYFFRQWRQGSACGFESNQNGRRLAFELSLKLFGSFSAWKVAVERLHLDLGVVPHNMSEVRPHLTQNHS
jgi:hypothetical protein